MKARFKALICWLRRRHAATIYLRESDQRVLVWRCDNCGMILKARKLSKAEQAEMRKMQRQLKYRTPLLKA